jgi:ribosomal protein S18 acetylase RimI-like enzyme
MNKPDHLTPARVEISPLKAACLDEVVTLHLLAFPEFFLSSLGPRFLREFYASFLADPQGVGWVAYNEAGEVVGVVVGAVDPRGYFGRLFRRRWWAFSLASLGAVARRPACVPRLLGAMLYRGDRPSGSVRALLSSVAVLPAAQGRGVGSALMRRWLDEVRRRGAAGCYLTTDASGNDAVNACYRSLGWTLEATFQTRQGRAMNRYTCTFLPAQLSCRATKLILETTPA